eukprot:c3115_g1_i1.p1 GENE.c3115_g1_i1~~c3115_g1_i1.p1  ORF type:complete len:125 (+),score=38.60 c3115_g1_i1:27-401(+)
MRTAVFVFACFAAISCAVAASSDSTVELLSVSEGNATHPNATTAAVEETPIKLPPTRAVGVTGRGKIYRQCMNHCAGLCEQLCAKFKALKVCNGCVRGCLTKCDSGAIEPSTYDPFHYPKPTAH